MNITPRNSMDLDRVLQKHWGITPREVRPFCSGVENPTSGSRRWVVDGSLILRADPLGANGPRAWEVELLQRLHGEGVPVLMPQGPGIVLEGPFTYQLVPYIPRQDQSPINYGYELSRAVSLGQVLAGIAAIPTDRIPDRATPRLPSIEETAKAAREGIRSSLAGIGSSLHRLWNHLEQHLFPFLPYLEQRFAHGDFHPANLLWEGSQISAVIDWDLAGPREELYDLAFFLGCAGMDEPRALTGPWAQKLIGHFSEIPRPRNWPSTFCLKWCSPHGSSGWKHGPGGRRTSRFPMGKLFSGTSCSIT